MKLKMTSSLIFALGFLPVTAFALQPIFGTYDFKPTAECENSFVQIEIQPPKGGDISVLQVVDPQNHRRDMLVPYEDVNKGPQVHPENDEGSCVNLTIEVTLNESGTVLARSNSSQLCDAKAGNQDQDWTRGAGLESYSLLSDGKTLKHKAAGQTDACTYTKVN